ncbi:hypothetical protein CTI12_AA256260 [Artemisia annua]|uniref:Uncharacterized protein n=1 Tax=Artemisia annua TaxID=35608 RepID=A0A2U1NK02_ARTAN|nr:hypothetical protein CTI12_AA256260 [Artemisia annua]
MHNCRLDGNQNLICGKVHIHTISKVLIDDVLNIKVKGKEFNVIVVEEARDVTELDIEEVNGTNHHDEEHNGSVQGRAVNDVVMSEAEDSDSGDESNDEEDESDEEKVIDGKAENKTEDVNGRTTNSVDRKIRVDEESRISTGTRVRDSFEEEEVSPEDKHGEGGSGLSRGLCMKKLSKNIIVGPENADFQSLQDANKNVHFGGSDNILSSELKVNNKVCNNSENGPEKLGVHLPHLDVASGLNKEIRDVNCYGLGPRNGVQISNEKMDENNVQDQHKQTTVEEHQSFISRGEKREDSPPNLNGSGGDRFKKKRKANMAGEFEGINNVNLFSPGVGGAGAGRSKKWIGRKTVKKVNGGGQKTDGEGLDDKKEIPEVYKEYHEVEDENKGVVDLEGVERSDSDSQSCSISLEQVKEIGEMIGVSWVKAESERMKDNEGHEALIGGNGDAVTGQQ